MSETTFFVGQPVRVKQDHSLRGFVRDVSADGWVKMTLTGGAYTGYWKHQIEPDEVKEEPMSDTPFFVGQLVRVKEHPTRQGFIERVGNGWVNVKIIGGVLTGYQQSTVEPVIDPGGAYISEAFDEEGVMQPEDSEVGIYERVGPKVAAFQFVPPKGMGEQKDYEVHGFEIRVTDTFGYDPVQDCHVHVYSYGVKNHEEGFADRKVMPGQWIVWWLDTSCKPARKEMLILPQTDFEQNYRRLAVKWKLEK